MRQKLIEVSYSQSLRQTSMWKPLISPRTIAKAANAAATALIDAYSSIECVLSFLVPLLLVSIPSKTGKVLYTLKVNGDSSCLPFQLSAPYWHASLNTAILPQCLQLKFPWDSTSSSPLFSGAFSSHKSMK